MKKIWASLVVLLLAVFLLPGAVSAAEIVDSGTCGENVTWTLDDEGTLTISGAGSMKNYWDQSPFYDNRDKVFSVIIKDGVRSIGDHAFAECASLTMLEIPESVSSIGSYAFKGCSKLTDVSIPSGVGHISDWTFADCSSLTSITLPASFDTTWAEMWAEMSGSDIDIYIGDSAFNGCSSLTSITIPDNVTTIGAQVFSGCSSLTSITIPDSVTTIGAQVFSGCSSLTSITIPDSVTDMGYGIFIECSSLTSVTLPDSITRIDDNTFDRCSSLSSIRIPDSVTYIGGWAFNQCSSLTSITIPESVTTMGALVFFDCTNLSYIRFKGNAPMIYGDMMYGTEVFLGVTATAYYPANNDTWTEEVRKSYIGDITWIEADKCPHGDESIVNIKAASCTDPGYTGDTVCAFCDATLIKGETTPALGHNYANGKCTRCNAPARVAGENRFNTAFLAANQMKQTLGIEKFDAVVVASGMEFADALSGSYLAAVKNAPILLACDVEKYNNEVKAYILENLKEGGTVYILGGENAVPAAFEAGLEGFTVERLAGKNRFDTNLKVLNAAGVGDKPILVATGLDFADCLSASAAKLPILLVYGDKLTADQAAFLEANKGRNLCIIGGTGAVSEALETQLAGYGTLERLAGKTRFETSVLIAEKFFENPESAVLAYAKNFPDGLCGGSLAATLGAPLILTMEKYETQAAAYIQDNSIKNGLILGGEALIPDTSISTIFNLK